MDSYFIEFPELSTPKIILRRLEVTDVPQIFELYSCEDVSNYNEMKPFEVVAEANILLRRFRDKYQDTTGIRWGIFSQTNEFIGSIGVFSSAPISARGEVNISFEVSQKLRGQGYASEAFKAIMEFCQNTIGVYKIFAAVPEGKEVAAKILKKFGFEVEFEEKRYNASLNSDLNYKIWSVQTPGVS
jgi:ribosomal-protein-alanine N-acetyltransferase